MKILANSYHSPLHQRHQDNLRSHHSDTDC